MCARRFLTFIFVLTLLFVAGAFAIYQWGGRVLIREAIPKGNFEARQSRRRSRLFGGRRVAHPARCPASGRSG